jgi:hypothetical protein
MLERRDILDEAEEITKVIQNLDLKKNKETQSGTLSRLGDTSL